MLICRVRQRLHQLRAEPQKLRCCISPQRLQQRCCHHSCSAMPSRGSLSGLELAEASQVQGTSRSVCMSLLTVLGPDGQIYCAFYETMST